MVLFVLYTMVPVSKPASSGEAELTFVRDTRGKTKPLFVLSSSKIEALLIVVELSPILTWVCAAKYTIVNNEDNKSLFFISVLD